MRKSVITLFALVFSSAVAGARLEPIESETPENRTRLITMRECAGCDLADALLSPLDLRGVDLRSAILTNALLYRSTLTGADLTGADLTGANLRGANLTDAKLAGAILAGADLRDAVGANLANTLTTEETQCPSGKPGPCQ